jgi:hypothetical protein
MLDLSKPEETRRVKTRLNDQSWKRKKGKEPCPDLALKKDKGKRIRDKTSYLKDEGKGIEDKNKKPDLAPHDTSSSESKG